MAGIVTPARITPAHAGTTPLLKTPITLIGDHPRSRGDHFYDSKGIEKTFGSPPLTRGPLGDGVDYRRLRGITPAHAGTTGKI